MSSTPISKNYFCLNIYKSELCYNKQNFPSYSLSFTFNNTQHIETDYIITPKISFTDKKYYFNIDTLKEKGNQIIIQAFIKTMLFIKKTFATITIPFTLSKCNDVKQWFFLKNENDQIILKILISLKANITKLTNLKSRSEISLYNVYSPKTTTSPYEKNKMLFKTNDIIRQIPLQNNKSMMNLKCNIKILNNRNNKYSACNEMINKKTNLLSIIEKDNSFKSSSDNTIINDDDDKRIINIKDIEREINNRKEILVKKFKDVNEERIKILKRENIINKEEEYIKKKTKVLNGKIKSLEKKKKNFDNISINMNTKSLQLYKMEQRAQIANELNFYNKEIYQDLNFIYYNSRDNIIQTIHNINNKPRQIINAMLNEEDITTQKNEMSPNRKIYNADYRKSKHLNSTNFTSNCSDLNLLSSDNIKPPTQAKNFYPINNQKKHFKNEKNSYQRKINNYITSPQHKDQMYKDIDKSKSMSKRKLAQYVKDIKIVTVKKSKKEISNSIKDKHPSKIKKNISS